jgi:hypothetical protein
MCFSQIHGTQEFLALKWAVFALLGVVLSVLFFCAKFLINFNKRAKLFNQK